jgi:hypothetical protein
MQLPVTARSEAPGWLSAVSPDAIHSIPVASILSHNAVN